MKVVFVVETPALTENHLTCFTLVAILYVPEVVFFCHPQIKWF